MAKKLLCVITLMLALVCVLASCGGDDIGDDSTAHTHSFSEWVTVKDATCTEKGIVEKSCWCGEKRSKTTIELGHSFSEWVTVKDATCTEEGSKHQICSVCNETIKTEAITKLSHTDGEWITDKEATCTEDGSKHQICSVCYATINTETLTKSHTDGEWITDKEATCTENGSKHQICSICKTTINSDTIFAFGHHFSSWIVEREASCGSDGVKKRICECGESETVSFSSIHMLQFQSASKYPSGSMFALWYCDICNTIVEKPFTAVSATCEWVGTSFGSYANAKYKLNVSGGTGNYSYNIVVSEDMYSTGNYTVINAWTQTSPDINCYVDYETLNRFNPIAITVWINDGAGIVAYTFHFLNFCNTSCITSLYIPYTLN